MDPVEFTAQHEASRTANWLIPGHVMCGHYPGNCPTRQQKEKLVRENLQILRHKHGIDTFVCLQDELPPQDGVWPEEGVAKTSERAKWATGKFQNYRRVLSIIEEEEDVKSKISKKPDYVHYRLPDLSVAKSLNDLDEIVSHLVGRVKGGHKLYVHCWGGRGRTGLVSACLLGALYANLDVEEALERVQMSYSLRQPWREKLSPETDEQKNQVREWFACKRTQPINAYGIWNKKGTERLELIAHSSTTEEAGSVVPNREYEADILGKGRFGQVFRGRCEHNPDHNPVAIKVTRYLEDAPTHQQSKLFLEATVLRAMSGYKGFPKVLFDNRQQVFGIPGDVLVMQLLGRPLLKRCWDQDRGDSLCRGKSFTTAAIACMGRDLVRALRRLHRAGYMHNDLKPTNMLFGAQGGPNGTENDVHLVDFGMVTRRGHAQTASVEGCELQAGGASPLFASLTQLEGERPTRPVDDMESLWYCLAFLTAEELPWQWEPMDRLTNIKRRLFIDECGIHSEQCTALVSAEDCCSTKHCFETCDEWDVPNELHEMWRCIVDGHATEDGEVDYDACLKALGGDETSSEDRAQQLRQEEPQIIGSKL